MQEKLLLTTEPHTSVYVRVAIPAPIRKYFDYLPPINYPKYQLQPGLRVQVPFGKQILIGVVVAIINETTISIHQLKHIIKVIDDTPLFPDTIQTLLCWASKYYKYPLGLVFDAALPTPIRNGKLFADYQPVYWRLTTINKSAQIAMPPKVTPKQQRLLELLAQQPLGLTESTLNQHGFNKTLRNTLLAKNVIEQYTDTTINYEINTAAVKQAPLLLNQAQQMAVTAITTPPHTFKTFLLDGVTGSGKTEVYLQAIAATLQQNKQVLILIPEINLTPQTLAQFRQRFSAQTVVFHSQITDKERTVIWFNARAGLTPIIIGTRSAAFIPLKSPGLFIIDEEHDQSFKQQDGFRYSARDLLIKRAQLENCPIILGSATPSLESLWNASKARFCHLKLPNRAGQATQPNIEVLDVRHKKLKHGLSLQLLAQIKSHLNNNGQVLLFLNRRGYAPVIMCNECNWVKTCNNCDARMILHLHPKPLLICHHCQTNSILPATCPACGNKRLAPIGFGTEKLEHILNTQFPDANIVRVDKDVTSKKNAMQNIVNQVITGEANILIGTQMLAKGHHFPHLSLVAIIDIDGALFSSDFRTIERMGQLITQVAGRAGRAELAGHVILQTQHPEHPLLQKLLISGYHSLCENILEERKASNLPPFSHQILFKASSKKPEHAIEFLSWLKTNTSNVNNAIEILGPIPAPIEKKAGYFRAQLLIQANERNLIHNICETLINKIESYPKIKHVLYTIDVDPLDFY